MKLFNILILLNRLINIKSDPWTNAISFPNMSHIIPGLNFKLESFFEYRDPNYLSERNVSKFCLTFNFQTNKSILQYSCRNDCSEISFQKITEDDSHYPDNTVGPIHCPMGGTIQNAYFKREEILEDCIFIHQNDH